MRQSSFIYIFSIVTRCRSFQASTENSTIPNGPEGEWLPGGNPWVFDSAFNPILEPPDFLEWILGDPAVIQLGDHIHMFANEVGVLVIAPE